MAQLNKAQEFLNRVLEKLPEDQREAVRSLYSAASDEATSLEQAQAAVIRKSQEQAVWYDANKDALAEYKIMKAGGGSTIDAKALEAMRDDMMGQGLALMTVGTTIVGQHFAEFGEALDMGALTKEAIAANQPLDQFYRSKVAPRRAERDEIKRKADLEAAKQEGIREGTQATLAKLPTSAMPYPVGGSAPTTLDGLRPLAEGAAPINSVQAAAATAVEVLNRATTQ